MIMWEWLIPVLLMGFAAGFLLGWSGSSAAKHTKRLDQELRETRAELLRYRDQVASHFSATADLMNAMSANYAAIHQHLVKGAHELCSTQEPRFKMISVHDPVEGETVLAEKKHTQSVPARLPAAEKITDLSRPAPPRYATGWYNEVNPDAEVTDYVKEDPRF